MATRNALRIVSRRFSSGKIFSEEEKAAENVFIKKMEKEKLEKIARQGPGEQAAGTASEAKAAGATASASAESGPKVSEDKNRNYAVVAGVVAIFGSIGWYLKAGGKKQPEVQE
ncbi:unnamed protein product [Arabidopsis lyrata]|uniref:F1F0-ATPase inhibitor protein n=2 Tax=Arabidopsis TaxID=3701 RepID=D7LJ04_ARALL|nr:uncharacterized protein At2g27730, mitochondrial [Arabidopsis lyrata subsp. lyrata]EFH55399.1 F1F0-ATPase inhibitor protein [Arabidopsis lyrata subsp. lyrata]KAG7572743.1 hypothetical protein ISN44_As09g011010 [Arabidopsis suecica]CAH8263924.1 unnamed protein product [Arabidopsis lyrata]|eukprot:XP_002879140.1 uncharacterized protein At2g27730, mitochondrial [Arabidopsis lyrata subsp. lyrata]